ncbi:MAG: DUF1800 family protein, partial [Terracidiphilus sp.]
MRFLRGLPVLVLCFAVSSPSPLALAQESQAAQPKATPARSAYRSTQLQGDARIMQALNRFTFGPTPGELEAVRAEGLDKWFNEQLHPQSIDESALSTRLAQFPAMQMNVHNLISRYPSNALVRMAMNGRVQIPSDPIERAIYENQIYRIRLRQQGRANKGRKAGAAAPAADANQMTEIDPPAMARGALAQAAEMDATDAADTEASTGNQALIRDILSLPPEQRVTRLASIREPEFDAFIQSLMPFQRAALAAGMTPEQKETVLALIGPER